MFKSIFAKQFVFYMCALVASFAILAVALGMITTNYFITQKTAILEEQARRTADIYANYINGNLPSDITEYELKREINILHEYLNSSLIITDHNNIIRATSDDIKYRYHGTELDLEAISPVKEGNVVVVEGTLGGIYEEPVLTVAYPVMLDRFVVGTVLLSTPMPELLQASREMFSITLVCLFVSGGVAFILIFILSRTMTKPLHEMNAAAKIIASGDFEKRIQVKSIDEVGQLATSFNNMAESLSEQEILRRVFISNVSHDLRSPLTSIRGFLQAILDGTIPPEKEGYYLNIVMDETERLSKLTHDIIDLSKLQSSEISLDITDFDVNDLIRKTVSMFEVFIVSKKLSVNLSFANEQDLVRGDSEKIQRVIYNLVDNAIKFTDEGGEIIVDTTVKDKKVIISVKDNGRGISPENQKHVFERFYKADTSRGEDKQGSGLGLSIVTTFLKAHNETITLVSEEGSGTTFTFSLPSIGR